MGKFFGLLAYYLGGEQAANARANVALAFGEKLSTVEVKNLARASFVNMTTGVVELIQSEKDPDWFISKVEVVGNEHIDEAFAQKKGVIWVTGHIGNWELMATPSPR